MRSKWWNRIGGALLVVFLAFLPVEFTLPADAGYSDAAKCARFPEKFPDLCGTTTTTIGDTTSTTQPASTTTSEPASTTTLTPSTTIPDGSVSPGVAIAGVGCSNTKISIQGYLAASSQDRLILVATGGRTISEWVTNNGRYFQNRPPGGYDGVWLQLCEHEGELTQANVEAILAWVWQSDPGIPVWISPLNYYAAETCQQTGGNDIPNDGAAIADWLTTDYDLVFRGPDLGPLTADLLAGDQCHPNGAGQALLGSQLVEFFDQ